MTNRHNVKNGLPSHSYKQTVSAIFTLGLCGSVFLLSLLASGKISHSVKSALSLCANVIIPSVFPFIILSDLLYAYTDFSSMNLLTRAFERIFKINKSGLYPFVLGMLCGFPLGVKCASELYRDGYLSRDEAERIIGFCNNTGPAFLVSGIGLGLRKSLKDGLLLYLVMVTSSIIVGMLFSIGHTKHESKNTPPAFKQFSITCSIKNAGINTLNICSYLTFFACIVGMTRSAIGENFIYLLLIAFLEVGSATSILSKTKILSPHLSLSFSAFAVGFSGMSVHLQSISFLSDTGLRVRKYFLMKLLQGLISLVLIYILYGLPI